MRALIWIAVAGCAAPRAGDDCASIEDTFCSPDDRATIFACVSGAYEAFDCHLLCQADDLELVECGPSADADHDVCICRDPCAENSPVFTRTGMPCRPPDDPTPFCRGDALVWCDPRFCYWQSQRCLADPGCAPYCDEAGRCAQACP